MLLVLLMMTAMDLLAATELLVALARSQVQTVVLKMVLVCHLLLCMILEWPGMAFIATALYSDAPSLVNCPSGINQDFPKRFYRHLETQITAVSCVQANTDLVAITTIPGVFLTITLMKLIDILFTDTCNCELF